MRRSFIVTCFAAAAVLVGGSSAVDAGSSFKVVTAPNDPQQAPTVDPGSSFKIVTAPAGGQQAPTVNAGSSFKIVTAPANGQAPTVNAGSSFKAVAAPSAQAVPPAVPPAVVPHHDEPLPGEPGGGEPQANQNVQREQILLPPNTGREVESPQFQQIVISDPTVLDTLAISDTKLVFKALKKGRSDVLIYNRATS